MLAASSGPSGWVLRPIWTITGPPNGSLPLDGEPRTRLDRTLGEVAEHRSVAVGDAREDALLAVIEVGERNRLVGADLQVPVWDRVAMRIDGGLAELGRDQLLQLLGDVVLQHLGLGVHPVP